MKSSNIFERSARVVTQFTGTTLAFVLAFSVIIAWLVSGPLFEFSDTWQLVINTSTTIVTFLMVFLIQRSQNKDSKAVHLKLNELVASLRGPSNRLIDAENFTEEELGVLAKYYNHLAELARKEKDIHSTHTIEEAHVLHQRKITVDERAKNGNKA